MFDSELPKVFDPCVFAENNRLLQGKFNTSEMLRLQKYLAVESDAIQFKLEFCCDEEGRRLVSGSIHAQLMLTCQRCLQVYEQVVSTDFQLAIVKSDDQAQALPDYLEPLLLSEQTMPLATLLEDELLLAMPQIPRHANEDCQLTFQNEDDNSSKETPANPFAVLKDIVR